MISYGFKNWVALLWIIFVFFPIGHLSAEIFHNQIDAYTIRKIIIEDQRYLSQEYLKHFITIRSGETYKAKRLETKLRHIEELVQMQTAFRVFFDSHYDDSGSVDIYAILTEPPGSLVFGGGEYFFTFGWRNTISFDSLILIDIGYNIQRFRLEYPYVNGLPLGLAFSIGHEFINYPIVNDLPAFSMEETSSGAVATAEVFLNPLPPLRVGLGIEGGGYYRYKGGNLIPDIRPLFFFDADYEYLLRRYHVGFRFEEMLKPSIFLLPLNVYSDTKLFLGFDIANTVQFRFDVQFRFSLTGEEMPWGELFSEVPILKNKEGSATAFDMSLQIPITFVRPYEDTQPTLGFGLNPSFFIGTIGDLSPLEFQLDTLIGPYLDITSPDYMTLRISPLIGYRIVSSESNNSFLNNPNNFIYTLKIQMIL